MEEKRNKAELYKAREAKFVQHKSKDLKPQARHRESIILPYKNHGKDQKIVIRRRDSISKIDKNPQIVFSPNYLNKGIISGQATPGGDRGMIRTTSGNTPTIAVTDEDDTGKMNNIKFLFGQTPGMDRRGTYDSFDPTEDGENTGNRTWKVGLGAADKKQSAFNPRFPE